MTDQRRKLILLGPQPRYESLQQALEILGVSDAVGLITAGWETEEQDDGRIRSAIGCPVENLSLFSRTEQLFSDDPVLIQKLRERQDELRLIRDAYNHRLNHLLKAARQIIRNDDPVDLDAECESSIDMVRQLDRQYFVRTSQIIDRYEAELKTASRPHVRRHRDQIQEILGRVDALLISGGHVAIILNRLKIFGILEMATHLPIVAWSGAAMALSDQVVFFHDSPPQGPGDPEVLRAGMGMFHDLLPLPDARVRLKLDDRARVELFAKRFCDFHCVILDERTLIERTEDTWTVHRHGVDCLGRSGSIVGFCP